MDYNCRDIPMKLDVKHQPLNFDIYLDNRIEIPRTSIDEKPYDFKLELHALQMVDQILQRSQHKKDTNLEDKIEQHSNISQLSPSPSPPSSSSNKFPVPSCPTEGPLTPVKSDLLSENGRINTSEQKENPANRINPKDFEDIHYNPFDHLELQTIDERRELDLVFRASYTKQK